MPVSVLLVEGRLDAEILNPILRRVSNAPAIKRGGSKGSLAPKARDLGDAGTNAAYIRDRDFDFEPPADVTRPTDDSALGWRWCRLNIECYLLEPAVVAAATGVGPADYTAALLHAAARLANYSAARWTIGSARASLASARTLRTRPQFQSLYRLPEDLTMQASFEWARTCCGDHSAHVGSVLADKTVAELFARYARHLAALPTAQDVLLWHCGRDLAAALEPLYFRPASNAADFVKCLAAWIREHSERALHILPEWQRLLVLLQG